MIVTVIYFTINDKLSSSRKLKNLKKVISNRFLPKQYLTFSSGTQMAQIDSMLKSTLAPPGGRAELVMVRHKVQ